MPPTTGTPSASSASVMPGHRALELPRHVRLLGVAEVQAVGEAERLGADAGEVGRALEHGLDGAPVGIAGHAAAVAVDRDGDRALRAVVGELEHRGVGLARAGAPCATAPPSRTARTAAGARLRLERAEQREQHLRGVLGGERRRPAPGRSARRAPRARGRTAGSRPPAPRPACRPPPRRRRSTRSRRESVTSPIAVERTSQRSQTSCSSASLSGSTTHSIRSWDSEIMISNGSMSSSRSGTFDTSMSRPTSPLEAISDEEDDSPAAPRSWSDASVPRSSSSRQHSSSFFSSNGSPICTEGRLEASSSSSSAEASTDAPPMPSRPVRAPISTSRLPTPGRGAADQPLLARDAEAHRVDQAVLLVGALEVDLAAHRRARRSSCRSGRCPTPRRRAGSASAAESSSPKRSESSTAIGRAPTANTSRRMPPTPVAAPWNGSTALGWLCDSTLNAIASPSPTDDRARVLARAHQQVRALRGQAPEQLLGVLVGAVLGPHQREHGQLEAVGLAPELLADQVELGVGEPELPVRGGDAHAAATSSSTCATSDSNRQPPSAEPVSGSTACSGWGIRPITFLPAVADRGDVERRAVGVVALGVAQDDLPVCVQLAESLLWRVVAARRVLDRDREDVARVARAREGGGRR